MSSIGYSDNIQGLKDLLYDSVPKLKLIQTALSEIHPGLLSVEIEKDVGFAYLMDYYLKFLDKFKIRAIFQHPSFTQDALTELFYCQITSIHKAKLLDKPIPEMFSSYWSYLTKPQYAALLKNTLSRTWNLEPAKALLSRIDLVHIKMLTKSGTVNEDKVLNLFKSLGADIKKVFSEDINLYDYAFGLAADASDTEFLNFLESYTMLFVQLRIASSFVMEIEKMMEIKGEKLSFPELFNFFANVPVDTVEVCLEIFSDKGWLSKNESEKILKSYANRR